MAAARDQAARVVRTEPETAEGEAARDNSAHLADQLRTHVAEETKRRPPPPSGWPDDIPVEREYFGIDHCKIGRSMAVAWNFMPSFVDVFEHHHHPDRAQHDPYLVGIVAAADKFLLSQEDPPAPVADAPQASEVLLASEPEGPTFLQQCLPLLSEAERQAVMEILQTEYIHLLPLVQLGLASATLDTAEPNKISKAEDES